MELPKPSEEYKDLKPLQQAWGVVYGPLQSRRAGLSLGVNLLGSDQKVCSYDCPYCELGLTELRMNKIRKEVQFPSIDEIVTALRVRLSELVNSGVKIDSISIAGNGEATLYPQFAEVVEEIIKVRNEITSQAKLILFTNCTGFDSRKNIVTANLFDRVMVKIDAGNDDMLKKMNSPLVRMTISKLIQSVKKLDHFVVQSCFVQGVIDNTTREHVDEWIEVIAMIKPKEVHIYTLDRVPAISGLIKADEDTLDIIGQRVGKRTDAKILAFS